MATGKNVISISGINELRSISGSENNLVSYRDAVSGRLKTFTWDANSSQNDDAETILKPSYFGSQSGRWVLVPNEADALLEWSSMEW